jgi:4-hydroxymandelate oxidase
MTERLSPEQLARVVTLADFEPQARARMAAADVDFVAGGSWDEVTLAENVEAWRRYRFVPRVLTGNREVDVSGSFLGVPSTLPIGIPPMAAQGMAHPEAEVAMARAAAVVGIPFCLSTSASTALEDVAGGAPDADRLFQLYLVRDLGYTRELVERAAAAGYRAIVLTVDLPVLGYRDRDRRNDFELPAMPMVDGAAATAADYGGEELRYGGLELQHAIGLTWDTVAAIRSWTDLPLVLKGILSPEDAALAVDAGAAGIVVSNHGARQLDRSIATADALAGIVNRVAGRCEIWVDGGVRRGLDVAIALALGASGVLVGRPLYWALAAGGQAGVERALAILREELEITLALLGCGTVGELRRELLVELGRDA